MTSKDPATQPLTETPVPLEGSFSLTISPAGRASFPNLITFTTAGGIVDAPPAPPGLIVNSGIGTWAPSKSSSGSPINDYVGKLLRFFADPTNNLVGQEEISLQLSVSTDQQTLSGKFQTIKFNAANGRELNREQGTLQGRRIVAA